MRFAAGMGSVGLAALAVAASGCGATVPSISNATHGAATAVPTQGAPRSSNVGNLLYVSEAFISFGQVVVYGYRDGKVSKLYQTLTGFRRPGGMCTNKSGDVWITDAGVSKLFRYQHGGSTPVEQINEPARERPSDCAIDPVTGNIAVSNHEGWHGVVRVFRKNDRKGTPYKLSRLDVPVSLTYDNAGNLFVVGAQGNLYELQPRGSNLVEMTLLGGILELPAGIQWINPNLLVGTQTGQGAEGYKISVSGYDATIVGSIPFHDTHELTTIARRAADVVVPDDNGNIVRIYRLSDGSLVSSLANQVSHPFGAVVSQPGR